MLRVLAGILAVLFALTGLYYLYLVVTGRFTDWWIVVPVFIVVPAFARYALRGNPKAKSIPQRADPRAAP